MKTVVTGGAGFIGSHLVDLLLEHGHDVTVIDNLTTGSLRNLVLRKGRPESRFVRADIRERLTLHSLFDGIDWVFHLAALADIVPSITAPVSYYETNVLGTMNVLESARIGGVKRFVYAASSSCYGIPEVYPTSEDAEIRPQYPYALTKNLGEQTVQHWNKIYKLPTVSLRLFNVYGPRSRTSGTYGAVFGVFLAQKLAGQPLTIVGDGSQTRDFIYVTDVAKAFLASAESHVSGRIYNVGAGNPISVNRIAELLGGPIVSIPKRPGEPDVTHANINRIAADLGWSPETTIERGVTRIMERINDWKDAPVWTPESISDATKDWFKYLGKG